MTHVIWALVNHEATAFHSAGITVAQEGGQLSTVTACLIGATLEVLVLIEDDLKINKIIYFNAIIIILRNTTYKYLLKHSYYNKTVLLLCPFWCLLLCLIALVLCPAILCHFYTDHDR